MKLQIEIHGKTYTCEAEHDGVDVYEAAEMFKGLLVNAGFHPSSVESIFDPNAVESWCLTDEKHDINKGP